MKKIVIILVVILFAAYTGLWYFSANKAKEEVEIKLKEYAESSGDKFDFQYESLSVGGYPFSYVISVNKLTFNFSGEKKKKLPGKISSGGSFKVGTNLFGTKYWIERVGELHVQIPADLIAASSADLLLNGNNRLAVEIENDHPFHAIFAPFITFPKEIFAKKLSLNELWNKVKSIEIDGNDISVLDVSHASRPIFSQDHMRFEWSHKAISPEEEVVKLYADFKGLQFDHAWGRQFDQRAEDQFLYTFFEAFYDVIAFNAGAKVDFMIDTESMIPKNYLLMKLEDNPPVSFNLKKMVWSSPMGESIITSKISSKKDKQDQVAHFEISISSFVNKNSHDLTVSKFINHLKEIAQNPKRPGAPYATKLLACCEKDLPGIIPHYDQLGKVIFDFNGDIIAHNKGTPLQAFTIKLKPLSWTSDPYSFHLAGDLSIIKKSEQGRFVLEFVNWEAMISDLVAYYNRLIPIIKQVVDVSQVKSIPPQIKEEGLAKILAFMQSLSDTPENKNQTLKSTIAVHGLTFTDTTIGKKKAIEVLGNLGTLAHELFPEEQPKPNPVQQPTGSR